MERERALSAVERTQSLLAGHGHLLPVAARTQLADDCKRLSSFVASLGPEAPGPQLATIVADGKDAEVLLWSALINLEERLSKAEAQIAEGKAQLAEAKAQLAELQQDHGRLLLRQMASQTENKLARCVKPGLKPKDVVHISFGRLSKGNDKGVDKAAFQRIVQRHPGLADGLESLKELGTSVAHPVTARTNLGGQQAVTSMLLRELIDKEYSHDDPVKPDVEAVLACLDHLAEHLGESIFVPTM